MRKFERESDVEAYLVERVKALGGEEWRSVIGYEGFYEVSSFGAVRSVDRHVVDKQGRTRFLRGIQIRPQAQISGHLSAGLTRNGRKNTQRVHTLVMAAFKGPRPPGMEVRHLDGDPTNNKVGNLEYGTSSENKLDTYLHKRIPVGQDSHLGRISNKAIAELKALKGSVSSRVAGAQFGLDGSYVRQIWRGEVRKHG